MEKLTAQLNKYLNALATRGAIVGVFLGLLPAALILYLGYSFFIEPGIAANSAKDKQVVQLETEVARGRAVEAGQEDFKKEFKKTIELFYESLPLLPKETELSNVLVGVQSAAGRYNVVLTGLNAVKEGQKTANADKLNEREMPATVVGDYDDVMRFFLDLSRQTRILIVRDYSVQSAVGKQKGARPTFVAVDFSLLAYHAPQTGEFPNLPDFIRENSEQRSQAVSIVPISAQADQPAKNAPPTENAPPPPVAPPTEGELQRLNERARELNPKNE